MSGVSGEKRLRVQLEFGDAKATFEGDADEVFKALTRFLTQIYPNLEVAMKITYIPDLTRLAEGLAGIIELTPDGPIFTSDIQLSAKEKICLALLGAHVGERLGKLSKGSLSPSELSRITGKARKTISNELPKLVAGGLVERTSEGECQITILGIRETENIIKEYKG
ncbi:MAG: hypothetical protein AYL32_003320 [Candidatus Bathyarchaeota archaeon B26-2]|nr:MAG: hypothetical protein AYL32_003320 [Candidatus Bathyarchaeota archaeon B26-2]